MHFSYLSHIFSFAKEIIACRHQVQAFFSCYSKMTATMGIIYCHLTSARGCGGEGTCRAEPPPATRQGRSLHLRQGRQLESKQGKRGRERRVTTTGNRAYGVSRICSAQIFLLRPQVSKCWFNDASIPGVPAACPLAIGSSLAASKE